MSAGTHAPGATGLRQLAGVAAQATDAKLLALVAALDRLPQRGEADAVLDPARARLRRLKPRRPLALPRLLFAPLDGLIVAPGLWRHDSEAAAMQVPRGALMPLTAAIRAARPELVAEVEAQIAAADGRDARDLAALGALGEGLWPAAGDALPANAPLGWGEAGLPPAAYPRIRDLCAAVWRNGPEVWLLRLAAEDGPPEETAQALLAPIAMADPGALDAVLAALLPFCARPAQLALAAGAAGPALDRYLATAEPGVEGAESLEAAAQAAERFAAALDDITAADPGNRPDRLRRLHTLRRETAGACRRELATEANTRLVTPLRAALVALAEADDAEMEALEETGRAVRSLADTAGRLDGQPASAPAIEDALGLLRGVVEQGGRGAGGGLGRVDALRLIEILAGPEAARAAASRGW